MPKIVIVCHFLTFFLFLSHIYVHSPVSFSLCFSRDKICSAVKKNTWIFLGAQLSLSHLTHKKGLSLPDKPSYIHFQIRYGGSVLICVIGIRLILFSLWMANKLKKMNPCTLNTKLGHHPVQVEIVQW